MANPASAVKVLTAALAQRASLTEDGCSADGRGGIRRRFVEEGAAVGYPDFVVMRPPCLLPNVGTLKRIAVAELAGIRMVSASAVPVLR